MCVSSKDAMDHRTHGGFGSYHGFESQIGSFFGSAKKKKRGTTTTTTKLCIPYILLNTYSMELLPMVLNENNIQDVQCLNKILKYIKYLILNC